LIFVVMREAGPARIDEKGPDQPEATDHAAFMATLADEDVVLIAGPLAESEHGRTRGLLAGMRLVRRRSTTISPIISG
jgi:hypothetical protein